MCAMKTFSIVVVVALLAGCSGMNTRGKSSADESDKPYSQRVLKPGDTYFGD
jgi:uncharacterized protein YceK